MVQAWRQQRQLGVLPGFALVKGRQIEEPGRGGGTDKAEVEDHPLLCYADQELVNMGNAEEVAAFQRYRQAQRRVPASRAALQHWVRQAV